MPFWKECKSRFDGYQLRGLCLGASQGGEPLKSTQEAPPSHDHVSGGNALPADFINSKWKLWDPLQWTIHLWWVAEPIIVSQTFQAHAGKRHWWVGWAVKTQESLKSEFATFRWNSDSSNSISTVTLRFVSWSSPASACCSSCWSGGLTGCRNT